MLTLQSWDEQLSTWLLRVRRISAIPFSVQVEDPARVRVPGGPTIYDCTTTQYTQEISTHSSIAYWLISVVLLAVRHRIANLSLAVSNIITSIQWAICHGVESDSPRCLQILAMLGKRFPNIQVTARVWTLVLIVNRYVLPLAVSTVELIRPLNMGQNWTQHSAVQQKS
ncbi:hypothetical protein ABKN59_005885 [Abortiporus biennis]